MPATAPPRRLLLKLLPALAAPRAVRAQDAATEAALGLLLPDDAARRRAIQGTGAVALGPWGGLIAVAVAPSAEAPVLRAAIIAAAGAPAIVAGPAETQAITLGDFWAPTLRLQPTQPLPGHPVLAVGVVNQWRTTTERVRTEALHLFLRQGNALLPIFGGVVEAEYARSEPGLPSSGWTRRYDYRSAGAVRRGLPDITVHDRAGGRQLARHRWRGSAYDPPVFDQAPQTARPIPAHRVMGRDGTVRFTR